MQRPRILTTVLRIAVIVLNLTIAVTTLAQERDSLYARAIAEPATHMVPLREGYTLFAQRIGTGPEVIILVHGGPGDTHEDFAIFKDRLPLDRFSIILYDQLGSYYSDQPADTTLWNIPRFVSELEQVRAFFAVDHALLLGHSFGGSLVMEYALRYPQHVKGLIVSNKSYSQDRLLAGRKEAMLASAKDTHASDSTIAQINSDRPITDTTERREVNTRFRERLFFHTKPAIEKAIAAHQIDRYKPYFRDRRNWDILDRLAGISAPTLLIGADMDFTSERDLELMHQRIPHSQVHICPNSGHFAFWDNPTDYFATLVGFIDGLPHH